MGCSKISSGSKREWIDINWVIKAFIICGKTWPINFHCMFLSRTSFRSQWSPCFGPKSALCSAFKLTCPFLSPTSSPSLPGGPPTTLMYRMRDSMIHSRSFTPWNDRHCSRFSYNITSSSGYCYDSRNRLHYANLSPFTLSVYDWLR